MALAGIDHDIHQHSSLSSCCGDERMTPQRLLENAVSKGYNTICITDHVWDDKVPGASAWYQPQNIAHIRQSLPLPTAPGVRFCFGCETEYLGGSQLGMSREGFDQFDFVVIPVNHFHMEGFVRPADIQTAGQRAQLLMQRLVELQQLDLPFRKIGIAHLTCGLLYRGGEVADVLDLLDEAVMMPVFEKFARWGTGIELNASVFTIPPGRERSHYRVYEMAKAAGCKFYFASDAHRVESLDIANALTPAIERLGITSQDIYRIP